jgi:hypothetical protein
LRKFDQVLNVTPDDVDAIAGKAGIAQAEGDLPRAAALLAPLHPNADDTFAMATKQFQAAEAENRLTRLPTGDGIVLVFMNNPEAPIECALEISQKLQQPTAAQTAHGYS